tara:strand:+ start:233 stop:850 length:618 start_codon:yes stop_codon:yes gene_type:complete
MKYDGSTIECNLCGGFYLDSEFLLITKEDTDCPHCYAGILAMSTTNDQKEAIVEILNIYLDKEREKLMDEDEFTTKVRAKILDVYRKHLFTDVNDHNWGFVQDNHKAMVAIRGMDAKFAILFNNMQFDVQFELENVKASIGDEAFKREFLQGLNIIETDNGFIDPPEIKEPVTPIATEPAPESSEVTEEHNYESFQLPGGEQDNG